VRIFHTRTSYNLLHELIIHHTSDPIKNFQQPLTGLHAHQFKQDGHPQKATLLAPFFSHVEELRQGV
jgi:hypothetical protein